MAADAIEFDIAPGRLDRALMLFARQAGVSINTGIPGLASARTRGLKGRHSVEGGLRILLAGTGYGFTLSGSTVRIARLPRAERAPARPAPGPAPAPAPSLPPPEPIIVTASKRDALLVDYPGTAHVATLSLPDSLRLGARGSATLLRELPDLTSTNLGAGRNKIFIRGIADSSFNGQNQATISQYFGESRLIYSAPDPDLTLYDIERVEVIEGPQGTLYGAGSLGGVIRLLPRPPDPQEAEAAATAGLTFTGGEVGYDTALIGNLPLGETSALRAVGYRIIYPGYIDDPQRGVSHTNRTSIGGVRVAALTRPAEWLELEAGIVAQNIGTRDGQYTNTGTNDLVRTSAIAQPFDNDYRLIYLTARADVLGAELVSNTSYVDHAIDTVFDATRPSDTAPRAFEDDNKVSLITHESRLSGSGGAFSSWVLGVSFVDNVNRVSRALGDPSDPEIFAESRSETFDVALFGEASIDVSDRLTLTGGARLSYNRQVEEAQSFGIAIDLEPRRSVWRVLPTAAISWRPFDDWLVYARSHEGYRPGSQRIVSQGGSVDAVQFDPDDLLTVEAGVRFGTSVDSRFYGGLAFAHSRWEDVQADLITEDGFPYLANIGSGFVNYVSARVGWRPSSGLTLDLSGFASSNKISEPAPEFAALDEGDLPNIAESGGRLAASYRRSLGAANLQLDGSVGYIGKSYLGIGQAFEREQGKYFDTTVGGRLEFGNWGLALDIDNILDSRANRFSFGNPFTLASEDQRTPLRPRTIRIGLDARF
ncbi:TonB-dependent receptor [Qipengyuania sp. YG27]|uniref:TonB-dependent receptor n=1 Tax=Qipengyuania mesophila TaxID=2867246 RepID=A0ABS7JWX4_9SPHN|nr:TonB-dependent receptor [Qipengyuania mesophila]MBX7502163.1 TonB-dependent receptor [Qipengyuania mesophila]